MLFRLCRGILRLGTREIVMYFSLQIPVLHSCGVLGANMGNFGFVLVRGHCFSSLAHGHSSRFQCRPKATQAAFVPLCGRQLPLRRYVVVQFLLVNCLS